MNNSALNRLETVSNSYLKIIERKLGDQSMKLPESLLLLFKYYKIGDRCFIRQNYKSGDDKVLFTCFKYTNHKHNYENFISGLLNFEEIIVEIESFMDKVDTWNQQSLFKIGYFDIDDLLTISLDETEFGTVYIWTGLEKMKIADNIFEFLTELKEEIIYPNLENIKVSQLYKNWGEDFWRVRDSLEKVAP